MLFFENDYSEGAHEKILQRLMETNRVPSTGYGFDEWSASAEEKIRAACDAPEAQVRFISGGTQTNQVVISALLESYEGVIAAVTGHVAGHEAGAIEATGHKVLTIPQHEGKLDAGELRQYIVDYFANDSHEHIVYPGMVYISHPTEYGTLYTKKELEDIAGVCREYDMPLFLDGARLGYGLCAEGTDVTLPVLARLCDVFYIGGTKVGALCGEAVVFTHGNMPKHFLSRQKQRGALLAKGRLCGIQFDTLFTDDLYLECGRNGIEKAKLLKQLFREKGYRFAVDSPTNQVFIVLENEEMKRLGEKVKFSFWEKADENHSVVRFATSWATTDEDIAALEKIL